MNFWIGFEKRAAQLPQKLWGKAMNRMLETGKKHALADADQVATATIPKLPKEIANLPGHVRGEMYTTFKRHVDPKKSLEHAQGVGKALDKAEEKYKYNIRRIERKK